MEIVRQSRLYQRLSSDTKRQLRVAYWNVATSVRSLRGDRRPFPSFLCIGTMRSGTTFLSTVLGRHPQVVPPLKKEVRYYCGFDGRFDKGPVWYRAHFPTRSALRRAGPQPAVTGEYSPYYVYHPLAPSRIRTDMPEGRFLLLLRDPVDRAYSQYQKYCKMGLEEKTFSEAIDAIIDLPFERADEIATSGLELARANWLAQRSSDVPRRNHAHCNAYLCWSTYAPYVERWFEHIPRHHTLVVRSEDLFDDPTPTLARICDFIGIEPLSGREFRPPSPPRDYESISARDRDRLNEYFVTANANLSALLGGEFAWQA